MNNPILRIARRIAMFTAACLLFGGQAVAQTPAQQLADRLRADYQHYFVGEATGLTIEDADANALTALAQSIRATVASETKIVADGDNVDINQTASISAFASLSNTEQIILGEVPDVGFHVMRYISRADLNTAIAEQREKIIDWVNTAVMLEKKVDMAGAIRYYYWALSLASVHPAPIKTTIDGNERILKTWLDIKLRSIMSNITVDIDGITERPGNANPYLVNLRISYGGHPVGSLDFAYFTGMKMVDDMHAKNGEATLEFPALPSGKIHLKVDYAAREQAALFDDELKSYFAANRPHIIKESTLNVEVKGNSADNLQTVAAVPTQEQQALAQEAPVNVAERRKRVEVENAFDPQPYIDIMHSIENAIDTRQYDSVQSLFTADGFALFKRMMESGDVELTRNRQTDYTIETINNCAVGKRIPVTIKYKGNGRKKHTCNEAIVLRFNPAKQIESVAYALTQRAEDDIFRLSRWGMEARYAMQAFMEDYQTAFALKRLDYIASIFDKGAIIINATVAPGSKRAKGRAADLGGFVEMDKDRKIKYVRRSKEEYLKYLRSDMASKKYIQLSFEDTDISKAAGVYDNVYWIELKQNYASDRYSDVGYLTLMINMGLEQPQIVVRTWTPEKIDLDEMKKRYTQD